MDEVSVGGWAAFLACPLGGAVVGWFAWEIFAGPYCDFGDSPLPVHQQCIAVAGREFTTTGEVIKAGAAIGVLVAGLLLAVAKFLAMDERRRGRDADDVVEEPVATPRGPLSTADLALVTGVCVAIVGGSGWLLWTIVGAAGLLPGLVIAAVLALSSYGHAG